MEFYCAFEALGYRSSPTGSSSDLAANQQQQGSNNAMLRYRPIQILLQTLCFVCELVIASPSLNLSFASDKVREYSTPWTMIKILKLTSFIADHSPVLLILF